MDEEEDEAGWQRSLVRSSGKDKVKNLSFSSPIRPNLLNDQAHDVGMGDGGQICPFGGLDVPSFYHQPFASSCVVMGMASVLLQMPLLFLWQPLEWPSGALFPCHFISSGTP